MHTDIFISDPGYTHTENLRTVSEHHSTGWISSFICTCTLFLFCVCTCIYSLLRVCTRVLFIFWVYLYSVVCVCTWTLFLLCVCTCIFFLYVFATVSSLYYVYNCILMCVCTRNLIPLCFCTCNFFPFCVWSDFNERCAAPDISGMVENMAWLSVTCRFFARFL